MVLLVLLGCLGLGLAAEIRAACTPLTILSQLQSLAVVEGCQAVLRADVAGSEPIEYLWYKNGRAIPGATNPVYVTTAVSLENQGDEYSVAAANSCSDTLSQPTRLLVSLDRIPPQLLGARAGARPDQIVLIFQTQCGGPSGGLQPVFATELLNYAITGGLALEAAELSCDRTNVILSVSRPAEGATYTVSVSNLVDFSGNMMSPGQATFRAPAQLRGMLRREVYRSLAGTAVADLTNAAAYPNCPDFTEYVPSFEAPRNMGEHYGQRLSGLLIPPTTTNYIFWLASDDESALFLGTDETAGSQRRITALTAATAPRAWASPSAPIPLIAGTRYYVEALMKEGAQADHLAVAWQLEGAPAPRDGEDVIPGTYLATYAPAGASIDIAQQPQSLSVPANGRALFSIDAAVQPPGSPLAYQWQRNSVDIPGANGSSYLTPPLTMADNFTAYRCFVRAAGLNRVSANAFLTVTPDLVPPTLAGVVSTAPDRLVVFFSESILLPAPGSFHVNSREATSGRYLDPSVRNAVEVELAQALTPGVPYALSITGIHDGSGNLLDPDPSSGGFVAQASAEGLAFDALRLSMAGTWALVEWRGTGTLQFAGAPGGPWRDLPDAVSPWPVPLTPGLSAAGAPAPRQFYRVRLAAP